MSARIVIIDYGSGNLQSVLNALELVKSENCQVIISASLEDLKSATHIILPGVGAFGDCISGLKSIRQMVEVLKEQVLINKKPFLGICVGMQLLADKGYEYGEYDGLGLISGKVVPINSQDGQLKIPHMGWNNLDIKSDHPLLEGIENGEHAYFVHSYHFICDDEKNILAKAEYGENINAIIAKDNIVAVQFHPEKSAGLGLKLLKNFISSRRS